jgi:hypothetical protein
MVFSYHKHQKLQKIMSKTKKLLIKNRKKKKVETVTKKMKRSPDEISMFMYIHFILIDKDLYECQNVLIFCVLFCLCLSSEIS